MKASLFCGLLAVTMAAATACGSGGDKKSDSPAASGSSSQANKPVEVTFWHSAAGDAGKALEQIVSDYNSSQTKVHVTAQFQGAYQDALTKLKVSMGSKDEPSLIQVYDVGTRYMVDTKAVAPVQNFIEGEKFDLSSYEAKALSYYKVNDKLYSMPFNTSVPVLYYNKTMFKDAGLDPEKPPRTFEEIKEAAKKLAKNDVYGIAIPLDAWYMEQFYAAQGAELVNNGNGRNSPATESYINKDTGLNSLSWWKEMIDSKTAFNYGRDGNQTLQAFNAGKVAMMLNSSGALRTSVNNTKGKFEVGVGLFPTSESAKDNFGIITGGASLWIMNDKPEEEQKAAWDFIKYLSSPKVQAKWSANTGYLPTTKLAYDEKELKDIIAQYPQFQVGVDELHQSKISVATQGAAIGPFTEERNFVAVAVEEALYGKKSPQDALNDAAKNIAELLSKYNK